MGGVINGDLDSCLIIVYSEYQLKKEEAEDSCTSCIHGSHTFHYTSAKNCLLHTFGLSKAATMLLMCFICNARNHTWASLTYRLLIHRDDIVFTQRACHPNF